METEPSIPGVIHFQFFRKWLESLRMTVSYPPLHVKKSLASVALGSRLSRRKKGRQFLKLRRPKRNRGQGAGATLRNRNPYRISNQAKRAYNRGIPGLRIRIEA